MNKKYFVALIVIALIAIGGYFFPQGKSVVQQPLGISSGPEKYVRQFDRMGTTDGGYMATTTGTISTYTVGNNDFGLTPTVVSWLPNANQTVTLTATATLPYIPNVGDVANVYFRNASTTAASAITFAAANANVDLQFAEATGGDLVLNGLDWAKFTYIRTSATLVTIIMDEMTEAD